MHLLKNVIGLKLLLPALLLCMQYTLKSQGFTYTAPSLTEVSFSGATNFTIKSDLDDSPFSAPHFIKSSNTRKPVGYVRNSKPKVTAKFSFNCNKPPQTILIRGDVSGIEGVYAQKPVTTGSTIIYPETESTQLLPNTAKYYSNYTINWKASFDNGTTWIDAGASDNPLYSTLGTPIAEVPSLEYYWYQTIVHIGCQKGDGTTTIATLFPLVWDYINDKNVKRVADNADLHYYQSWLCGTTTTGGLIKTTDGQCGAWAKFLIDIMKVQGFSEGANYTIIEPSAGFAAGFYVKSWSFASSGGSSGDIDFPYLNKWGTDPPYDPSGPFNWHSPEVTDTAPLGGQNQPHPQSRFGNHQFVRFMGNYYDPAYGVTYATISGSGFPDADPAVGAFFYPVKWLPNTPPRADIVKMNPVGNQITPTFYIY